MKALATVMSLSQNANGCAGLATFRNGAGSAVHAGGTPREDALRGPLSRAPRQEPVEVLDLYQDKPSRQEMPKKPEQKPEQANKWLAFQQLVSQQAAEEALQKVGDPHQKLMLHR